MVVFVSNELDRKAFLSNIKSINSIDQLNALLNQNRLKIVALELNNGMYFIEATK